MPCQNLNLLVDSEVGAGSGGWGASASAASSDIFPPLPSVSLRVVCAVVLLLEAAAAAAHERYLPLLKQTKKCFMDSSIQR